MTTTTTAMFDIVVVGGGINGAGIAADAAGRGLKVLLADAGDLGGATSSASSKLIHGGLRYLEQYEFRLVREALGEREVLLKAAPHIVWPLQFVLPHVPGMRPRPVLRAGLLLYDHLSQRRSLGSSSAIDLTTASAGRPLKTHLHHGFSYWDCWVDDARLVIANAIAARERGAAILPRTAVTGLAVAGDTWRVTLGSGADKRVVAARVVVNAAGPWVDQVARLVHGSASTGSLPAIRLVKGSHIVVPRIPCADTAYIFQNTDGRVVFALPYEGAFTLIGTTDRPYDGDPRAVSSDASDDAYLLDVANRYFSIQLSAADIVWRFSGVRPLDDDGSANPSKVSRDYRLQLDTGAGPPMLHVIGGKITTYRRLAEAALDRLTPHLAMGPAWTAHAPLPGGEIGPQRFDQWFDDLVRRRPGIGRDDLHRLARRYGSRIDQLLGDARSVRDLGVDLGGGLRSREVAYFKANEWASTPSDVVWRRTKAALHVPATDRQQLESAVAAALDNTSTS